MAKAEDQKKSILEMARGAFMERADYEMQSVVDNIMDPNTSPTAKRKVTITMEFIPDAERQNVTVSYAVASKLAPTNPVKTSLYIAGADSKGELQVVEMVPNIPGQQSFYDPEQEAPPLLRMITTA